MVLTAGLVATVLVGGVGVATASAQSRHLTQAGSATHGRIAASDSASSATWPKVYTIEFNWDGSGYEQGGFTLKQNHTFSDPFGGTGTWSHKGNIYTMAYTGGCTTYTGKKTRKGFDSPAHPGTMVDVCTGESGVWYGVKS